MSELIKAVSSTACILTRNFQIENHVYHMSRVQMKIKFKIQWWFLFECMDFWSDKFVMGN